MVKNLRSPHFTHPRQQAFLMVLSLVLFIALVVFLLPKLAPVFLNSPYLNGLIATVFIVGVLACFWQIFQLTSSVQWINAYSQGQFNKVRGTPRLLAPLAVMMKGNQLPTGMSTASSQSILDSVAIRLDEIRDITRYLINLLIFLGLLGTFYGLATTIPAVVETIGALRLDEGADSTAMLTNLMSGLESQLGGMGTAFSSSLIGLTGSLVVGLLELFAGHGQNQFYREFEEWLSHFTSVGMAETGGLELAVDPNDDTPLARAFRGLSDSLVRLDQRLESQGDNVQKIENIFEKINENMSDGQTMSADVRNAVRGLETQLVRMGENMAVGRDASTQEMRRDLLMINESLREIIDMQS